MLVALSGLILMVFALFGSFTIPCSPLALGEICISDYTYDLIAGGIGVGLLTLGLVIRLRNRRLAKLSL